MKKIYTVIVAVLLVSVAAAQSPTTYFMEGTTVRSQFNPAFAPYQGYVNMPFLGGISANVDGNVSLSSMVYPRNGGLVSLIDQSVSASEALGNLKPQNVLGADMKMNIIGFGSYLKNKKSFWSFDLGVRTSGGIELPIELFEFIKNGNDGKISNISMQMNSYVEAGFNYSMPLMNDKLYVGARLKVLTGLARVKVNYDQFDVTMDEDRWEVKTHGSMEVNAGGAEIDNDGSSTFELGDISLNTFKPTGFGLAVDLGATYEFMPGLKASLAVTDLGFINWGKNSIVGESSPEPLVFEGMDVVDGNVMSQPDFSFQVLEFQQQDEGKKSSNMLNANINAGASYEMANKIVGFGLLYSARVREFKSYHNITGAVDVHPLKWLTLAGSYTVIGNNGGCLGLGLNVSVPGFNLFVATDLITAKVSKQFIPVKRTSASMSFGLAFNIGQKGERQ